MAQLGHQEGSGDAAHPVPFFTSPNMLQKLCLISLATLSTMHPTRKPRSQDAENRTCRRCLAVGPCCGNLPALSWAASAPRADVGGKEAPGDTNTAFPSPTTRALCSSLTPQPTADTSRGSYGSKTRCCPYHTTWKINRKNEPCC